MKYAVIVFSLSICALFGMAISEMTTLASEIEASATTKLTYERLDEFTFSKPIILDEIKDNHVIPKTIGFDDAIRLIDVFDKTKQLVVIRMAKGTLDKGDESEALVLRIVDRLVKCGFKRVVILENRGMGIPINYDTDNK